MDEMTDRQALGALLRRFGVTSYTGQEPPLFAAIDPPTDSQVILLVDVGGVGGYSGFHAIFDFDPDGKFRSIDIWE